MIRHGISLPAILFGLGCTRWPESAAAFFANASTGRKKQFYESSRGTAWIRICGIIMVGFGIYWVIVGTG